MQVSFVIVGAQKSGTTALYAFLRQNPKVEMSQVKETGYFWKPQYWRNGANYSLYHRFFHRSFKAKLYGEASPTYMLLNERVAPRIFDYNPSMNLIFILKNPIERVYSSYKMLVKKNGLALSFEEYLNFAVKQSDEEFVIDEVRGLTSIVLKNSLELGRYSRQIKEFKKYFNDDQMLIILREDLLENHDSTLNRVFDFIGAPKMQIEQKIIHSFSGDKFPEELRCFLVNEYKDEIAELEILIGRDLSHWLVA